MVRHRNAQQKVYAEAVDDLGVKRAAWLKLKTKREAKLLAELSPSGPGPSSGSTSATTSPTNANAVPAQSHGVEPHPSQPAVVDRSAVVDSKLDSVRSEQPSVPTSSTPAASSSRRLEPQVQVTTRDCM